MPTKSADGNVNISTGRPIHSLAVMGQTSSCPPPDGVTNARYDRDDKTLVLVQKSNGLLPKELSHMSSVIIGLG